MKAPVTLLLFLAALLAAGSSLECEHCTSEDKTCTKKSCGPGEDSCFIAMMEDSLHMGERHTHTFQGCVASSVCSDMNKFMDFGPFMKARAVFTCCKGDACKTTSLQIPQNMTPVYCPICEPKQDSYGCDKVVSACPTKNPGCLNVTWTPDSGTKKGQSSPGVCTSPSACAKEIVEKLGYKVINEKCPGFSNTAGPALGSFWLLLLALTGLLLEMLLS